VKLSDIRSALDSLGRAPSKSLGQNFLHDQNIAKAIVAAVDPQPGDHLVEIGPGLGALTEFALDSGATVTAIEKDGILADFLRDRFAGRGLEVVHGDALDFDLRTLWPRRPVKILGNLPYYVSSQLIFHFTGPLSPAERCLFLIQRELADRLRASANSKEYGLPTVLLGRRWLMKEGRRLRPGVFLPEPKVDSALIEFTRRPPGDLPDCDPVVFERAARAGFSQRRKQLRKLLELEFGDLDWSRLAATIGVVETARAEALSVAQWVALTNFLSPIGAAQNATTEIFDVVDENDQVVDHASRGEVHAKNLRHRATHVFIFNARGEIFLQRRSAWKDQAPGCWGSSAAGHVDRGEAYPAAALRELAEELALDDVRPDELESIATLPPTSANGWEFVRLFRLRREGPFRWPAEEVETGAFFPPDLVNNWMERRPLEFSPGFRECWSAARGKSLA
jgi:16S rRNA (adenine1518-N6/adenine1519-N6)-dimethyltransferase